MAIEPRRSALPWIAVAAVALLAGGGFAALRYGNVLSPAAPAPASQSAAPEAKPRTVSVVILPANATVEVDGTATPLSEGVLEMTGAIGSVHKVRVAAGGGEKIVRVVVSDNGAVPAKIELESAAAPSALPTAAPTAVLNGAKPKPKPTAAPTVDPLRNKR